MRFSQLAINCQQPLDGYNVSRVFNLIECSIEKGSDEYNKCIAKAHELAELVNTAAANNAELSRLPKRRANDAIMGVLAEEGWLQFINSRFSKIASYTPFDDPHAQIDIQLNKGQMIEIRSSFVKNGVKFAICNGRYNFKNIGPYSNTVKPGEVQKNLYLAVLFNTPKDELLQGDRINFTLIGGSTWQMMVNIGYDDPLEPKDALVPIKSRYRVIQMKDVLDVEQVINNIASLGYNRQ